MLINNVIYGRLWLQVIFHFALCTVGSKSGSESPVELLESPKQNEGHNLCLMCVCIVITKITKQLCKGHY